MLQYRTDPFMLVVLSGLVFFGWGEIFSLFPSTLTDTFGTKYATTNYGFLYMAQGVGSILGAPVAAMIFEKTGSWMPVFGLVIGMDILTGTSGAVRAQADAPELDGEGDGLARFIHNARLRGGRRRSAQACRPSASPCRPRRCGIWPCWSLARC